jgi:hypothetical protein
MLMHEVEIGGMDSGPQYLYIQTDDDIELEMNENGDITHLTTIDTDMGLTPDLIIKRRKE